MTLARPRVWRRTGRVKTEYFFGKKIREKGLTFVFGSIPVPGWWVVMVLNQAKLGQNYDEHSRICTKQSNLFSVFG